MQALIEALDETEKHLRSLGFESIRLLGARGFAKIQAIADGVEAVYASDESKRRFEILSRVVFTRFKALVMEPAAFAYAERHDNIEAIYKKLEERRDTVDVTELLKELHRIVNEAIRAAAPGDDQKDSKFFDLSQIDLEKRRAATRRSFDQLHVNKTLIEEELGGSLSWERLDDKRAYRIQHVVNLGACRSPETEWPAIHTAMVDGDQKLLLRIVRELSGIGFQPVDRLEAYPTTETRQ